MSASLCSHLLHITTCQVIWQPYRGGPDDEMAVVQEGRTLFERDIWLHAPQVAVRLVVSRVARQLGHHQVVPAEKSIMHRSYPGWGLKAFKRRHPCRKEIKNWRRKGRKATFGVDASAWSDYEVYWRTALHRYILPESYSCGASYSISNCAEAAEASSLARVSIEILFALMLSSFLSWLTSFLPLLFRRRYRLQQGIGRHVHHPKDGARWGLMRFPTSIMSLTISTIHALPIL